MQDSATRADWDLTPYFTAIDGDDYASFRDALSRDIDSLRARAEAMPGVGDDPASWAALLTEAEDVAARFGHLSSYLSCTTAADATDERGQREEAGLATLGAAFDKVFVHVKAAFKAADDDAFEQLVADERLAPARHYLERMRKRAARTMSADLEGLTADLSVDGIGAWGRLYDRVSGNLTFELLVDGKPPQTHPVSMARSLLEDADPEVRTAALRGSGKAWASVADTVAACLNAISGTRLSLYARRGIDHFLEPALFDAGIEQATLDAMLSAVRARQDVARRYLHHKAVLIGKPRLGFQDCSAPLPRDDDARIPWDGAVARVRDAFGASYPALREFADHAFDRRWIDYQPRRGKRPGGFCTSSKVIGESRVFMTYNGAMGDVQTLAHELGHAFHNWLMRDMRPWRRSYPMTLAETASTFAENVVTDATLANPNTSAVDRAAILDSRLQDAEAFLLNIPSRFDFEHALYTRRADGELSVRELGELMLEAQRANYGDALAEDELDPWFWASKLHFYITEISFYNFPYTFGYLFSMGIFARAKAEGAAFLPKYEALLRATGSAPAEQVAQDALGVDLRQPDFWNASIDLIEADLAAFIAATS